MAFSPFVRLLGGQKSAGAVDYLIVGLGNPGKKYENTRHNAGFIALDYLCSQQHIKLDKSKFHALFTITQRAGKRLLLAAPQTFMNLSGQAVEEICHFYQLPPERVVVLCDDISLQPGKMRIRRKGSAGTHNGLRSIVDRLDSQEFIRIKIGVGERPDPRYDLADWVLSHFTAAERKALEDVSAQVADAIDLIVNGKIDQAMNLYNS